MIYDTNQTNVYILDDSSTSNLSERRVYGAKKLNFRYMLLKIDNFSKFGLIVKIKKTPANRDSPKRLLQHQEENQSQLRLMI